VSENFSPGKAAAMKGESKANLQHFAKRQVSTEEKAAQVDEES